ncbi:MAG: alpha/beta fold hydrolase [Micrococcaceae bacterium]
MTSTVAPDTRTSRAPHIHEYPGEGRLVVLLHGLLASAKYWGPVRRRLSADGYRVVTIDLLGFGAAAKAQATSYDYAEHVEHVRSAIETVAEGEPVILVGHSLGGLVSMKLARRHPELVSQLVVLNAPLYRDGEEARASILDTGRLYRFLLTSKFRALGWATARLVGFPLIGRHSAQAREGALEEVVFRGKGLSDLRKLNVPAVVVTGAQDREVYLSNLDDVELPESINVYVSPTGHHLPTQAPHYVSWILDALGASSANARPASWGRAA